MSLITEAQELLFQASAFREDVDEEEAVIAVAAGG